jgi:hypothetical protein
MKSRLSFAVTPQSDAFPGTSGAMRAHCASVNTNRTNIASNRTAMSKQAIYLPASPIVHRA